MRRVQVFADLAAAVADGADCIDGVGQRCGDREHVFGAAASTTTMWRLVDRVSTPRTCRGCAEPGRRPERRRGRPERPRPPGRWLHIDIDATLIIDAFRQQGERRADLEEDLRVSPAAGVSGPPEIAGGEALAGLLRAGNAGLQHRR